MPQPSSQQQPTDYLRSLLSTATRHRGLWFIPLVSAGLIALMMIFLGPKTWDATQAFVVREELIGRIVRPGRFESLDTMKTVQEVIQETARRPSVLKRVYSAMGVDSPSPSDIEQLQGAISFHAPGGAELGKTEILSMRVKSSTPEKATRMISALFDETRAEIRSNRSRKAKSMMEEVGESVTLAKERVLTTSKRIRQIESSVGEDLAELRSLNEPYAGGGELRKSVENIQREIREARKAEDEAKQLIEYLQGVGPDELLATPRELLVSQPALSELKNRLIEAQVIHSTTAGRYSERHPKFQATANSVTDIREQINQELASSLVGLESQRKLARQRISMLSGRSNEIEKRIAELAAMRVDYGQLVSELKLRNDELRSADREFAQAESMFRASEKVDLISRLDEPQAGIRPLGPSNKAILLGALFVGALVSLGLIMVVTPSPKLDPPTAGGLSPVSRPTPVRPPVKVDDAPARPPANPEIPNQPSSTRNPGFVIPELGGTITTHFQQTTGLD